MNDRSPLIADFPPNELSNLVPRSYPVTVTEIYNHLVVKGLGKRLQTYIQSNPNPWQHATIAKDNERPDRYIHTTSREYIKK